MKNGKWKILILLFITNLFALNLPEYFSADFTQKIYSDNSILTYKGKIFTDSKKVFWKYTYPNEKEIWITDKVYVYEPDLMQVTISKKPKLNIFNAIKNAKKKKGLKMLEAKIVELTPVEILYVRKEGAYDKSAKEAWEVLMSFAYKNKIKYKKNLMGKDAMMFGIGHDNPNVIDEEKLRFDACISWDDKTVQTEGEISNKIIDGGKYAMFIHKGAYENLKSTYDMIGDWIVESGTNLGDKPMFEKYLNRDPRRTKPENLKTEIYVPIS